MATITKWQREIEDLEKTLSGVEQQLPWPVGWERQPPQSAARVGVAATRLDGSGSGFRRDAAKAGPGSARSMTLEHRASERFPAASTMKVYVLQALLEAVQRGELDLEEPRSLAAGDAVTGSGVLKLLTPGISLSLHDLAALMITVSDNTATNMLIDVLGIEAISACVAAHGWSDTYLRDKLQQSKVIAGAKSSPSLTSPRDLADYFARLWLGELLPAELTVVAKSIYRQQQFSELGRSLDYDGYSAEIGISDMVIASKSGSIRGVRNDAGVFEISSQQGATEEPAAGGGRASEEYVIVVMTDGCPDRRFHPDNLGARVVGEAAAITLTALRS